MWQDPFNILPVQNAAVLLFKLIRAGSLDAEGGRHRRGVTRLYCSLRRRYRVKYMAHANSHVRYSAKEALDVSEGGRDLVRVGNWVNVTIHGLETVVHCDVEN